jgi:GGDEF domain-containing protein
MINLLYLLAFVWGDGAALLRGHLATDYLQICADMATYRNKKEGKNTFKT